MIGGAIVSLLVALAASWWGTGLVRRFTLARSVLDIPNQRSSHSVPTPRGGGIAIVAVVLAGLLVAAAGGWIRDSVAVALIPSGAAVALVSWLDDRRGVPQWVRFLVHIAAAIWVVYCFGPIEMHLGLLDPVVTVVGIVWMANLFNFMDGIDGLAAGEALTVGLAAMLLCWRAEDLESTWLAGLVAAGAAGFLMWNWQPARIFLGDVGSVFLGFIFASLAVLTSQRGDIPALGWLVLLGLFFVDATITLVRRVVRREKWLEAHRSHAYQRAVQGGLTHARVTGIVMAVNAGLALLVWWAIVRPGAAPIAYVIALVALVILYGYVGWFRPM